MMQHLTILSLCDATGNISKPYREAGYNVIQIDLATTGHDVRLLPYQGRVHGIIAQPPCTHLANSGARWFKSKGEAALLEALSIADACLRMVAVCKPRWWVLENPVGRLRQYYGPPAFTFNPCDYGKLAEAPEAYTKKTLLWGNFVAPTPIVLGMDASVLPTEGSRMHRLPPTANRAALRSVTPTGFARAFFIANP
jgi:hypothetical protein